jgi:hypothetical protein
MKRQSLFFLLPLVLLLASANVRFAENVTGTWMMEVQTDMGSGSPTFVLKQDEKGVITGTYSGQLGETPVKGTLKEDAIHLEFDIQGNLIQYDGTVAGDTMKGKVKLGSIAEGTFSGNRKS